MLGRDDRRVEVGVEAALGDDAGPDPTFSTSASIRALAAALMTAAGSAPLANGVVAVEGFRGGFLRRAGPGGELEFLWAS